VVGGVVLAAVLVGGPFVYFRVIQGDAPAPLALSTPSVTLPVDLTLHGVTNEVSFDLQGVLDGASAQVVGSIPIAFADWNIANPSYAPVATTQDNGILEFSLNFSHA
jgi:hypothetical protein